MIPEIGAQVLLYVVICTFSKEYGLHDNPCPHCSTNAQKRPAIVEFVFPADNI